MEGMLMSLCSDKIMFNFKDGVATNVKLHWMYFMIIPTYEKKPNNLSKVGKRFNESMKDHSNQTQ